LIREVLRTGKIPTGNPFFSNNKVCGFPGYFKLNCAKWRGKILAKHSMFFVHAAAEMEILRK